MSAESTVSAPHICQQMGEFIKISKFTGEMSGSVKSIRSDLNVLFGLVRDLNKSVESLKDESSQNIKNLTTEFTNAQRVYEVNIKGLQVKYTFIGVLAAALFQVAIIVVKSVL
jgi:hypothetical protein